MSDKKISQLTPGTALVGDAIPIARSGANFQVPVSSILSLVPAAQPDASRVRYTCPKWQSNPAMYDVPQAWISPTDSGNGSITFAVIQPTASSPGIFKLSTDPSNTFCGGWQGGSLPITLGLVESTVLNVSFYNSTNVRYFVGLVDSIAGFGTGYLGFDFPTQNMVCFRYSTAAGDTTWKAICQTDDTHHTVVDTAIPIDTTGALHKFEIRTAQGVPGTILFFIDDVQVASISTNVPAATLFMTYVAYAESLAVATVSVGMNTMESVFF